MKKHKFYEKMKKNWHIKIACLIIAIFISFFHKNMTLSTRSLMVPLQVKNEGTMIPASYCPPQVSVSIRGNAEEINQIIPTAITAYLNIDYFSQPGKYDIPVQIELDSALLAIEPLEVTVKPGFITMDVAAKVTQYVPVEPNFAGSVAEGYEITDIKVSPSSIELFGAETLVKSLKTVATEKIDVEGKNASFKKDCAVEQLNELISYNTKNVTVEVTVDPIVVTRDFIGQQVYLKGLNSKFYAEMEPLQIDYSVSGDKIPLENFIATYYTAQIDCSKITKPGMYQIPVSFVLPVGCDVVWQSTDVINLTVMELESIFSEDFSSKQKEEETTETGEVGVTDKNSQSE